jgi:hypothetical protein
VAVRPQFEPNAPDLFPDQARADCTIVTISRRKFALVWPSPSSQISLEEIFTSKSLGGEISSPNSDSNCFHALKNQIRLSNHGASEALLILAMHTKTELEKNSKSFSGKEKDWLGGLDSNQDSQIQSQETESRRPPDKPLKT